MGVLKLYNVVRLAVDDMISSSGAVAFVNTCASGASSRLRAAKHYSRMFIGSARNRCPSGAGKNIGPLRGPNK